MILLAIALDPFSQQLLQLQPGTEYVQTTRDSSNPDSAFTTQAIEFNKGETINENVKKSVLEPEGRSMYTVTTRLDIPMQAAVLNGISRSQQEVQQQATTQCSSANCTWDPFETLGVCHRCNDLTSTLKTVRDFGDVFEALHNDGEEKIYHEDAASALVLPNGHFLTNINGCSADGVSCLYESENTTGFGPNLRLVPMTSFGTGNPIKTNSMQDLDTLIWSMSIINLDYSIISNLSVSSDDYKWPNAPIRATECALYYCVKTMHLSVEGNIVHNNDIEATDAVRDPNSWTLESRERLEKYAPENRPPDNGSATLEYHKWYSAARRSPLALHFPGNSSKTVYNLTTDAVLSLSQFFQNLLSTNITEDANISAAISKKLTGDAVGFNGIIENKQVYQSDPPAIYSVWNPDIYSDDKADMRDTFAALATSITNGMRQVDKQHEDDADYVFGRKGAAKKYYKTQWGWTALHGAVLVGGILFWAVTVWNSTRGPKVPAWKNSSLATISRGSVAVEALRGADMVREMEKRAREELVKIPIDDSYTLVQTTHDYSGDTSSLK